MSQRSLSSVSFLNMSLYQNTIWLYTLLWLFLLLLQKMNENQSIYSPNSEHVISWKFHGNPPGYNLFCDKSFSVYIIMCNQLTTDVNKSVVVNNSVIKLELQEQTKQSNWWEWFPHVPVFTSRSSNVNIKTKLYAYAGQYHLR